MNQQALIVSGIALVIGAILFVNYYFSQKAIIKRKLKKAVSEKLSQFANGDIAKVVGKIEFVSRPLVAPLSNRPCAYYHVMVEQQVSTGKSSHWKTIITEENTGTFVIRDGKYCAHVNSEKIKSYIVDDRKYSSGFLNDASEVLENYLNSHGEKSENFLGLNKTIRYKEGVLEAGEYIAVMGRGEWKSAAQEQLPDSYDKVLVITSTETDAVYLSDDPDTVRTTYYRYEDDNAAGNFG
jgi:hypothetical protein